MPRSKLILLGCRIAFRGGSRWDKGVHTLQGVGPRGVIKSRGSFTTLPPHSLMTESAHKGTRGGKAMW